MAMATVTRALEKNTWLVYGGLLVLLSTLLVLSPAEATLGNIVKIVYAHGAAQRVALYAYLIAGGLGIVSLSLRAFEKQSPTANAEIASQKTLAMTERWSRALMESAIAFWLIQFVVSLPAQILAWGAITWSEPRVVSALWILVFTALVYIVALWIGDARWTSIAAIANAAIALILLRGAANILHPIDPILGSDSLAIKGFYLAIVLTIGALAFQFARDRARA
ncbi:hypothetical protein ANRL3_02421 [Anaerolineae bacterium]|nr:hypothetical protein ANRL3_02421 [Anaerolineae bacterium]